MYRTMMLGQVDEKLIGQSVQLAGWVKTIRDHGGIVFIDIRDKSGVVQLKTNDDSLLTSLSKESVISATGKIVMRSQETFNPAIKSGKVEMEIESMQVLSKAEHALPFEIDESLKTSEEVRLKYRYLDLRNSYMQKMLALRDNVAFATRCFLREKGFTEVATPILTVPAQKAQETTWCQAVCTKANSMLCLKRHNSSNNCLCAAAWTNIFKLHHAFVMKTQGQTDLQAISIK